MPNWVSNKLEINGTKADVQRFIDHVSSMIPHEGPDGSKTESYTPIDLNKMFPMPPQLKIGNVPSYPDKSAEELQAIIDDPASDKYTKETCTTQIKMIKNRAELGYDSWYEWSNKNWGTKWNVNPDQTDDWVNEGTYAYVTYDTAWGPPNEAIRKVSEMFPKLKIRNIACDPGMNWSCTSDFRNGSEATSEHKLDDSFGREVAEELGINLSSFDEDEEDDSEMDSFWEDLFEEYNIPLDHPKAELLKKLSSDYAESLGDEGIKDYFSEMCKLLD